MRDIFSSTSIISPLTLPKLNTIPLVISSSVTSSASPSLRGLIIVVTVPVLAFFHLFARFIFLVLGIIAFFLTVFYRFCAWVIFLLLIRLLLWLLLFFLLLFFLLFFLLLLLFFLFLPFLSFLVRLTFYCLTFTIFIKVVGSISVTPVPPNSTGCDVVATRRD